MPRFALFLVVAGLLSILGTITLVLDGAMLPGGLSPFIAAVVTALGGASLVLGLYLVESHDAAHHPISR
ncbi:MAG TPA: hypothetical protein VE033_10140 [Acetobacteraceae bacterium]|jgi:hypothetical protein|nr:hypothetical protein [Acetobacteraceae bacterium]